MMAGGVPDHVINNQVEAAGGRYPVEAWGPAISNGGRYPLNAAGGPAAISNGITRRVRRRPTKITRMNEAVYQW